ncbi:hypothetical protein [Legionella sp. CNM-4043-24]|uniref:hypothetical protein n=1 Tax=Legionella sp. CNM-4043-24 TaxID=3421646 RepID=UPI00403A975D
MHDKKFTAEIVSETTRARHKLKKLEEKIYDPELLKDVVGTLMQKDISEAHALYPICKKILALDKLSDKLVQLTALKHQLLQDTLHRRVWMRTGKLKQWIESRLPTLTMTYISKQLSQEYQRLALFLGQIQEAMNSGGKGWLEPAIPCDDGAVYNEYGNPILLAIPMAKELEKSPLYDAAMTTYVPIEIQKQRTSFLTTFSVFHQAANQMKEKNPAGAQREIEKLMKIS